MRDETGFSLLELIVTLGIIALLGIMLVSRLSGIVGEAAGTCALEEMNNIKRGITDMFYPDIGCLPEDPYNQPWYATRYLCLRDDRDDITDDPDEVESPECYDMWMFLGGNDTAKARLIWDRYKQKGWRGPYMAQDVNVQFDPDGSGPRAAGAFPLITSPWADKCEKIAQQEEEQGNYTLAEECRRGKYYLIVTDKDDDDNPIIDTVRIISFGANCWDDGSYHSDYKEDDTHIPAELSDLRKPNVNEPDNPNCYFTGDDIVVFPFGGAATRRPLAD